MRLSKLSLGIATARQNGTDPDSDDRHPAVGNSIATFDCDCYSGNSSLANSSRNACGTGLSCVLQKWRVAPGNCTPRLSQNGT